MMLDSIYLYTAKITMIVTKVIYANSVQKWDLKSPMGVDDLALSFRRFKFEKWVVPAFKLSVLEKNHIWTPFKYKYL